MLFVSWAIPALDAGYHPVSLLPLGHVRNLLSSASKQIVQKSRECHNHKPQPSLTQRGREKGYKLTRAK